MGFDLYYLYPRNMKGHRWNQPRVYRLYPALNLWSKHMRRDKRDKPNALSVPTQINQVW